MNVENCLRFDIDSFKNYFDQSVMFRDGMFMLMHQNIRSFNKNIDKFMLYLNNLSIRPKLIVLSETWFSASNYHDILGYRGTIVLETKELAVECLFL